MFHIVHRHDQRRGAGEERLEMVCVHASDRFIIEWVDDLTQKDLVCRQVLGEPGRRS